MTEKPPKKNDHGGMQMLQVIPPFTRYIGRPHPDCAAMMTRSTASLVIILWTTCIILLLLAFTDATILEESARGAVHNNSEEEERAATASAALFEPVDSIRVSAPTHFPKPTRKCDDDTVQVIAQPTFGAHRRHQDAVFAYAEGYRLPYYMMFMETLTATGFTGDVVLAIAEERIIKDDVSDYLKTFAQGDANKPHIVVYQIPLECEGDPAGDTRRTVTPHGDTDMFQMCQLTNVYGWKDEKGNVIRTARDPRPGRTVATLRYEWYWIWSLQYNAHSWLMLIDARDAYFQTNPFVKLPRRQHNSASTVDSGLLYMFGENTNATRLGKSKKNKNWISRGYGPEVMEALDDKPTICSGSTMGEQVAVETYLRALINEHDEGQVRMAGSDQGFHNYLYYSRKLTEAETIDRIILWDQGRGIINNLGALRTQPLVDWKIYNRDTNEVYQWDYKTLSPVVHQWDRDNLLHAWMNGKKHKNWATEWEERKKQASIS